METTLPWSVINKWTEKRKLAEKFKPDFIEAAKNNDQKKIQMWLDAFHNTIMNGLQIARGLRGYPGENATYVADQIEKDIDALRTFVAMSMRRFRKDPDEDEGQSDLRGGPPVSPVPTSSPSDISGAVGLKEPIDFEPVGTAVIDDADTRAA